MLEVFLRELIINKCKNSPDSPSWRAASVLQDFFLHCFVPSLPTPPITWISTGHSFCSTLHSCFTVCGPELETSLDLSKPLSSDESHCFCSASSFFYWLLSLRLLFYSERLEMPICRWSSYPLQPGAAFTYTWLPYSKADVFHLSSYRNRVVFVTCWKKYTSFHYKTFKMWSARK